MAKRGYIQSDSCQWRCLYIHHHHCHFNGLFLGGPGLTSSGREPLGIRGGTGFYGPNAHKSVCHLCLSYCSMNSVRALKSTVPNWGKLPTGRPFLIRNWIPESRALLFKPALWLMSCCILVMVVWPIGRSTGHISEVNLSYRARLVLIWVTWVYHLGM